MLSENSHIISAINRISRLSKDIGPRIWTIPGEAINTKILDEELSATGRFTAEACISLWNGSQLVNLQDLLRYDYDKFKEFMAALTSIHQMNEFEDLLRIMQPSPSDLIPPGNAIVDDVVIVNIKPE